MVDVDLVVAGAGAAGCAAALAAAESGATVLLVDARATFRTGCNTAMSTSMIPAAGTPFQEAHGVTDSPAAFLADIMRKTRGSADLTVATALTAASPHLVRWLHESVDIPLNLVTDFNYPGHSVPRCHAVPDRSGRTLHRHMLARIKAQAGIDLVVPLQLVAVEPGSSAVTLELRRPDASVEHVAAGAVVLATNGFGANKELVREHLPEIADALYHGGDGSTGDALRIGAQLGADTAQLDAYQGHGSVAIPHRILVTWATIMHGGILVDRTGRRFGDETVGYSEFGAAVVARPGHVAWLVYDERVHDACLSFSDYRDLIDANAIEQCDDAEQLAQRIGCRKDVLAATLRAADDAARGQRADEYHRVHWEQPLRPPYRCVRVTGALFHTQGGLRVDGHGRVLRGGEPIPRVYAAGGAAVGISGSGAGGYLAGNGLLAALGLGFLAGRHAGSLIQADSQS